MMLSVHPLALDKEPDGVYGDVDAFLKDCESGNQANWYAIFIQRFERNANSLVKISLAGARVPGCAGTEGTEGHP
jgi:hypothetical protein